MKTSQNLPRQFDRFKDAPWFKKSREEHILVMGAGGIGSNTMYNLTKTIPANYHLVDMDKVEIHNTGTQFYRAKDIGQLKVLALANLLQEFNPLANITKSTRKFEGNSVITPVFPITITGFDNMVARKAAFEDWRKLENREIFIDGRLRATLYDVFTVVKGDEERYEKTLFADAEIPDDDCTFKQTAFFGMLIGARITNIMVNYLTNKYSAEPVCAVPFHIKELGELCHVSIQM